MNNPRSVLKKGLEEQQPTKHVSFAEPMTLEKVPTKKPKSNGKRTLKSDRDPISSKIPKSSDDFLQILEVSKEQETFSEDIEDLQNETLKQITDCRQLGKEIVDRMKSVSDFSSNLKSLQDEFKKHNEMIGSIESFKKSILVFVSDRQKEFEEEMMRRSRYNDAVKKLNKEISQFPQIENSIPEDPHQFCEKLPINVDLAEISRLLSDIEIHLSIK